MVGAAVGGGVGAAVTGGAAGAATGFGLADGADRVTGAGDAPPTDGVAPAAAPAVGVGIGIAEATRPDPTLPPAEGVADRTGCEPSPTGGAVTPSAGWKATEGSAPAGSAVGSTITWRWISRMTRTVGAGAGTVVDDGDASAAAFMSADAMLLTIPKRAEVLAPAARILLASAACCLRRLATFGRSVLTVPLPVVLEVRLPTAGRDRWVRRAGRPVVGHLRSGRQHSRHRGGRRRSGRAGPRRRRRWCGPRRGRWQRSCGRVVVRESPIGLVSPRRSSRRCWTSGIRNGCRHRLHRRRLSGRGVLRWHRTLPDQKGGWHRW